MYSCKRKTCHHLFLLRFLFCFDFPTISKLIVRPSRRHVAPPLPLPLPPTLWVLTFAFSFLMWIGSEISTTRTGRSLCRLALREGQEKEGGRGRLAKSEYVNICITCEERLINNFCKECACSWRRPPAERNGIPAWGAWLGRGHACVCVSDSSIPVPCAAALPVQNFCHKSCCRIWRKCLQSGGGVRASSSLLQTSRLSADCRLSQRRHSSCLFVCSAYCLPLPPTPTHNNNYQHLVYTPGIHVIMSCPG